MQIRYPIIDYATVKDSPIERWAMDLNRYFSREAMKMTNKHMKRCSTSLALCAVLSHSVVSDSLRPHGLQPCRLLCPWDSLGKNTGVGCHDLLQKIFPTQGSNPGLLYLPFEPPEKGILLGQILKIIRTRSSFLCLFHFLPSGIGMSITIIIYLSHHCIWEAGALLSFSTGF